MDGGGKRMMREGSQGRNQARRQRLQLIMLCISLTDKACTEKLPDGGDVMLFIVSSHFCS